MGVEKKDIEHVALLSKFELTDSEKGLFVDQIGQVLKYIEKLNKLNTDNIEPLIHPLEKKINVFRDDKPNISISREEAQSVAPAVLGAFFKVPKVIE